MKFDSRHALWGGLLLAAAAAAVRLVQAAAGSIPGVRAASEVGLLVAGVCMAALLVRAAPRRGVAVSAVLGVALVAWGAAVVLPLWRLGHPPAVMYDGRLGGATREVRSQPAARAGRHLVEAERLGTVSLASVTGQPYVLHAGAGTARLTLTGAAGGAREAGEVLVARGESVLLFLERSEDPEIKVRVRPVPLPWGTVALLGLAALLLAVVADVIVLRERVRLRGLLAAIVAAAVIYVGLLNPETQPGGRVALGAGGLALVGGGLLGAMVSFVGGKLPGAHRRRPAP